MKNEIRHIRIDGRLIHGQVVTKWIFVTEVNRIIVVDDELLNNPIEKNALKISTPSNIKLSILSAESAAKNINAGNYYEQKVMILVKVPKYLRMLSEFGLDIDSINVGNISQKDGSIQVKPSVFLSEENITDLKYLISKGINVTTQMVPAEAAENMSEILNRI